ncbi:MAG: hypothetical protein FJ130_14200 [Deltaproteobacteria bacterium]|nr:hypothetical protein [Deltaproteobacteria bacterium]
MRRVLFLCDRPLGIRCLEFLLTADCQICGVVSRGGEEVNWWGRSSVRNFCEEERIAWYNLSRSLIEITEECQPDLIISVLYPKIVAKDLVKKIPCFNLHCAPLPEYGGWNSTLWAILNGEETFGATLHQMSEGPDEGDIIEKGSFRIPRQVTNIELYRLSHEDGYRIFCENVSRLISERYSSTPQAGPRRYYGRMDLPSREVCPEWGRERIAAYARAFYFPPFEPAYMMMEGQKIRLIPERLGGDEIFFEKRSTWAPEEKTEIERGKRGKARG